MRRSPAAGLLTILRPRQVTSRVKKCRFDTFIDIRLLESRH